MSDESPIVDETDAGAVNGIPTALGAVSCMPRDSVFISRNIVFVADGNQHSISSAVYQTKLPAETVHFVDFDEANLRACLNYYRNGKKSIQESPQLWSDLERLESAPHQKTTLSVGGRLFCSTCETLSQLPVLRACLEQQKKSGSFALITFDRDPVLFQEILTRLRHPLTMRSYDPLIEEELVFWGAGALQSTHVEDKESDTKETEEQRLIAPQRPLKSLLVNDLVFNAQPHFAYHHFAHPDASPFVNRYFRYTQFARNTVTLQKDSTGTFTLPQSLYDAVSRTYVSFDTAVPICGLESLFDVVSVQFEATKHSSTVSLSHTGTFMQLLALLDNQAPFSMHRVGIDSQTRVVIPLRFFFCESLQFSIPTTRIETRVSLDNCALSRNISVLADVYTKTDDERDVVDRREQEWLVDRTHCLLRRLKPIPAEDGKDNVETKLDMTRYGCFTLRNIFIVVCDASTKQIVPCTLLGKVEVGPYSYELSPTHNMIAQQRHRRTLQTSLPGSRASAESSFDGGNNASYDERVWLISLSEHSATRVEQPTGHLSFSVGTPITLSFSIECQHADIEVDVYITLYDALRFDKTNGIQFVYEELHSKGWPAAATSTEDFTNLVNNNN